MCAAALVWAGASRIVYAAAEPAFSALLPGRPRFDLSCRDVVGSTGEDIEIVGPCLGDEALVPFQAGLAT
jgi:tRNA(Arg) A34 adenosine deaminase TadA